MRASSLMIHSQTLLQWALIQQSRLLWLIWSILIEDTLTGLHLINPTILLVEAQLCRMRQARLLLPSPSLNKPRPISPSLNSSKPRVLSKWLANRTTLTTLGGTIFLSSPLLFRIWARGSLSRSPFLRRRLHRPNPYVARSILACALIIWFFCCRRTESPLIWFESVVLSHRQIPNMATSATASVHASPSSSRAPSCCKLLSEMHLHSDIYSTPASSHAACPDCYCSSQPQSCASSPIQTDSPPPIWVSRPQIISNKLTALLDLAK